MFFKTGRNFIENCGSELGKFENHKGLKGNQCGRFKNMLSLVSRYLSLTLIQGVTIFEISLPITQQQ